MCSKEINEIKKAIKNLQQGYTERSIKKVDDFMEKLFIKDESLWVLGTSTEELFFGAEEVKKLFEGDWQYWGDVFINYEEAHIEEKNNLAWFAARATVKQAFEDSQERYESYINFIKEKAEDKELTVKQRLTFINWVLALTYHQRREGIREYFNPLNLSGVLRKVEGNWKFVQLHFSIPRGDFPDERFENHNEYMKGFEKQKETLAKCKSNEITLEVKRFMEGFSKEFFNKELAPNYLINKYFSKVGEPYIISPDNKYYFGNEELKEFLSQEKDLTLNIDMEHLIGNKVEDSIYFMATGTFVYHLDEDKLLENTLKEMCKKLDSSLSSKEKLFAVHRSVAYAFKETAAGERFTWPIRVTGTLTKENNELRFNYLHFSYPFSWIFEGKIDET